MLLSHFDHLGPRLTFTLIIVDNATSLSSPNTHTLQESMSTANNLIMVLPHLCTNPRVQGTRVSKQAFQTPDFPYLEVRASELYELQNQAY